MRVKTKKLLEQNTGRNLHEFGEGNGFLLAMISTMQTIREKNTYIGHHQN
jgi:hypothetical protein